MNNHRHLSLIAASAWSAPPAPEKARWPSELSRRLHIPHVELDALHWGPNWTHCTDEEMRQRAEKITQRRSLGDGWKLQFRPRSDLAAAEAVIWLDYPLPLILWQLWWRTWKRVLTKETLWGTNRERLWPQFFSKDSLFLWALQTYKRRKRTYAALISSPEYRLT